MIQSKKIVGATILYLALSAGFAFAWRVELPRFPVTFVEWALLLVGALPASLAIEFAGRRLLKTFDYAPGAQRGKVWISRTLLAMSLVAITALCLSVAKIVQSA